jgi:hypothetical protein
MQTQPEQWKWQDYKQVHRLNISYMQNLGYINSYRVYISQLMISKWWTVQAMSVSAAVCGYHVYTVTQTSQLTLNSAQQSLLSLLPGKKHWPNCTTFCFTAKYFTKSWQFSTDVPELFLELSMKWYTHKQSVSAFIIVDSQSCIMLSK